MRRLASFLTTCSVLSVCAVSLAQEPAPLEPAPPPDAPPALAPSDEAVPPAPPAPPRPVPSEPAPEPPAPLAPGTAAPPPPAASPAPPPAQKASEAPTEVLVAGSRLNRIPGSAQVITNRQLERFEYDDPSTTLLLVPGIYVRQEDGVGLRPNIGIRGGNPDRSKKVTLMEDGVLFGPAPYSAPAAYYFPLTSRMTQIRVVKGPSAIAYGPQTVGGAIDFISRPIPSRPSAQLDLAFGEYGYDKVNAFAGASNEQFGASFELMRLHNTGFKRLPDASADTGATRNDWVARASYVIDPRAATSNKLGLKLSYSDEKSNETYLGLTDADFRADPYRRYAASALDEMKNHRISFVLSHRLETPGQKLRLTTNVYRHDYARIWRKLNRFGNASILPVLRSPNDPANQELIAVLRGDVDSATGADSLFIGPNDRTFVSQGIQSVLESSGKTGPLQHSIQAGARLHYDSIERRHSEDEFLMSGGKLVPAGTGTLVNVANLEETYALALHALDAVTISRLTLTPGARLELIRSASKDRKARTESDASVVAVMPGIGAYYAVTAEIGVLGGAYRGFSPPPPGDAQVEPEYSINYEAGARYSKGGRRLEAIGFFNDYSNLTDICTFSSSCDDSNLDKQFSAGGAHIWGIETYGSYEIDAGPVRVPLSAAYTFTRSKFLDRFESADPIYGSVEKGDELPYIPRHQGSLTIGVDSRWVGAALAGYHVARMREEAGSGPLSKSLVTDQQTWLDLSAYVRPLKILSIYANWRNVTGAENLVGRRPFGARPNAPRWLQVGAKLDF